MRVYYQPRSILLPSSASPQPGRPVSGLMDAQQQQHRATVRGCMAQGCAPLSHTLIPPSARAPWPLMTEAEDQEGVENLILGQELGDIGATLRQNAIAD